MNALIQTSGNTQKIIEVQEIIREHKFFDRVFRMVGDLNTTNACIEGFLSYLRRSSGEGTLDIARIDGESLARAFLDSCELKLPVGQHRSLAYLVPFSEKSGLKSIRFIVSYKGYIELAARIGIIIFAKEVKKGDTFSCSFGMPSENNYLKHIPNFSDQDQATDSDKITHFYAIVRGNGIEMFDVMSDAQMKRHRELYVPQYRNWLAAGARPKKGIFWIDHYDAMGKKTIIKRLINQLPLGDSLYSSIRKAIEIDENPLEKPEKEETQVTEENQAASESKKTKLFD